MLLCQDEGVKSFISNLTSQLSEWLEAGKLQRIVLVIMSKSSGEVLERWNFSIETDNEVVETGFIFNFVWMLSRSVRCLLIWGVYLSWEVYRVTFSNDIKHVI